MDHNNLHNSLYKNLNLYQYFLLYIPHIFDFLKNHLLSIITLLSLIFSIIAIKFGFIKIHSFFMIGTYIGLFIAGIFTLMPGRYIANFFGI